MSDRSGAVLAGSLRKMRAEIHRPVNYALVVGKVECPLNVRLGQVMRMAFGGEIRCVHCGRATRKSFNQGHCFPCSQRLAACDVCIVMPERCHYDQGTCREPVWAEGHCMQPHVVYLANSSGLKVGITRASQVPTRWIDQGACEAIPLARVRSRYVAGLMESALKQHVADKTDWRRMLKGPPQAADLRLMRKTFLQKIDGQIQELRQRFGHDAVIADMDSAPVGMEFPVLEYPAKVRSITLEKQQQVEGTLVGVKGQYLILDTGVLNVRRHGGYQVSVEFA